MLFSSDQQDLLKIEYVKTSTQLQRNDQFVRFMQIIIFMLLLCVNVHAPKECSITRSALSSKAHLTPTKHCCKLFEFRPFSFDSFVKLKPPQKTIA